MSESLCPPYHENPYKNTPRDVLVAWLWMSDKQIEKLTKENSELKARIEDMENENQQSAWENDLLT